MEFKQRWKRAEVERLLVARVHCLPAIVVPRLTGDIPNAMTELSPTLAAMKQWRETEQEWWRWGTLVTMTIRHLADFFFLTTFYFSQGAAHSQDLAHFVRNTHAHSHVCVHTCTSLSLSHSHWKWHWGQDNGFVWAVMMRHVRAVFYLTSRTDVSMAVTPHCLISLRPVNHH